MNIATQLSICNLALMRLGATCDLASISGTGKPYDQIAASYDLVRESVLSAFPWHFNQKRAELDYVVATISGATQANPVVVTLGAVTAFANKDLVEITQVDGMTSLNDTTFMIDNVNGTNKTFELYDDDPSEQADVSGTETLNTHSSVDGTTYGAYTANGQMRLIPKSGYGFAYTLPSDCLAVTTLMDEYGPSDEPYEINCDRLFTNLQDAFIEYGYQITDDSTPIFHATFVDCFAWRLASEWAKALTDDIDVQKQMFEMYRVSLNDARHNDAQQNPRNYSYTDKFISCRG